MSLKKVFPQLWEMNSKLVKQTKIHLNEKNIDPCNMPALMCLRGK